MGMSSQFAASRSTDQCHQVRAPIKFHKILAKMKSTIFGLLAVIVATANAHVELLPSSTLVRTPSLDSAVVHSHRHNGAFSYSTVENQAYTVPVVRYVYQQYPQVFYPAAHPVYAPAPHPVYAPAPHPVYAPAQHPIYAFHPAYYPTLGGVPQGGAPGVNPQNPIEVESPADNAPNDEYQQANGSDEDTVAVDSA